MEQSEDAQKAAKSRSPIGDGPASYIRSNRDLWQRTMANSRPRWATWTLAIAVVLGVVLAIGVYFASESMLAASVILGVCWLVGLVTLNFTDLSRRASQR
jgi:membrane-associated PAP2 superfamily phosphatase